MDTILSALGVILAVIALPSVFQTCFGRPSVVAEQAPGLRVIFKNKRIGCRVLRFVGVLRSDATLRGQYRIQSVSEDGTLTDVYGPSPQRFSFCGEAPQIPPTIVVRFGVGEWVIADVGVPPDLPNGLYIYELAAQIGSDEKRYQFGFFKWDGASMWNSEQPSLPPHAP